MNLRYGNTHNITKHQLQDTNSGHGIGYPSWGDSTTGTYAQIYTQVFDACTDCPAGKISAAIGASTASTCASCAAGKYQDAVVVTTNPPEASRTYSSAFDGATPGNGCAKSMLDSSDGWCAAGGGNPWTPAVNEFMQIDLGSNFLVHGVVTQCRGAYAQ
jgi:hypothetical protein